MNKSKFKLVNAEDIQEGDIVVNLGIIDKKRRIGDLIYLHVKPRHNELEKYICYDEYAKIMIATNVSISKTRTKPEIPGK